MTLMAPVDQALALPGEEAEKPLHALAEQGGTLAMLTGIEGGFYRPLGALMAITPDGRCTGTLSGGCVDADVAQHGAEVLRRGHPKTLRYGAGAANWDLRPPCGAALEIRLAPVTATVQAQLIPAVIENDLYRHPPLPTTNPINHCGMIGGREGRTGRVAEPVDESVSSTVDINATLAAMAARQPVTLRLKGLPALTLRPTLNLLAIGQGAEAEAFCTQAAAAGFTASIHEPNAKLAIDAATAIAFFVHDHDQALPLLARALESPAFWIGAMGSQRSQDARLAQLRMAGLDAATLARLHGPIGLIRQARSPEVLALSVLAEIIAARPWP